MAAICTCERCKKQFESRKSTAKYCPSCRVIINRERTIERTRQIREDAYETERDVNRQRSEAEREKRKRKFEEQEAKRIKKLQADADAGDLIARLQIAENEKDYLHSVNYWKAFQDYAQEQTSYTPGADYIVNLISVRDPDFPQKVIESLKSGRIRMDWINR